MNHSTFAPWVNFPAPATPVFPKGHMTATLVKTLSSADMATLQTSIETNFPGVKLSYEGAEYAYQVTIEGRSPVFQNAYRLLVPRDRPDITRQRSDIPTP